MPNGAMINYLSFSCCMIVVVRVVMMAISLHLLLWVGIVKVWCGPAFVMKRAPSTPRDWHTGPMASAKSRPTASRKKGRLLCDVKNLLGD